jgi:hypothetical protein
MNSFKGQHSRISKTPDRASHLIFVPVNRFIASSGVRDSYYSK